MTDNKPFLARIKVFEVQPYNFNNEMLKLQGEIVWLFKYNDLDGYFFECKTGYPSMFTDKIGWHLLESQFDRIPPCSN